MNKKPKVAIGVDPGVNTGLAVWDLEAKDYIVITSSKILDAFDLVKYWNSLYDIEVILIEDARKVKYNTSRKKAQGAGSIKRDCKIWEDFIKREAINARFPRPDPRITKWSSEKFKKQTGYKGETNEHKRDAAMLIYNM